MAIRPLSLGSESRRRRSYQGVVRRHAKAARGGVPPFQGAVYARIVWFHTYALQADEDPDLDNLVKPILDALVGVLYADDRSVVRLTASHHHFAPAATVVRYGDLAHWQVGKLEAQLGSSERDILYVEVGPTRDDPVVLGPVDGVRA